MRYKKNYMKIKRKDEETQTRKKKDKMTRKKKHRNIYKIERKHAKEKCTKTNSQRK